MIEQQVRPWDVLDQRVLDVLGELARDQFVDESHRGVAYSDFQLPIGFGQSMLKPNLEGRMLQALQLNSDDVVLEVGTGSGYLTACLASLASEVDSVELVAELADSARSRLAELKITNVSITQQDASQSWDSRDQYDAIALGGAVASVPDSFRNKLAVGGRLFAVVGNVAEPAMEAVLITRVSDSEWNQESLFETRIDPLVNFDNQPSDFTF